MYKKNPKQLEALEGIKSHNINLIFGSSGCLSGDSIIDGTGKTIEELTLLNKQIEVETPYGKIECDSPFKKGEELLYEVKLENGKRIECTKDHRFYSLIGWRKLKELSIDCQIACSVDQISSSLENSTFSSRPQTNLEFDLLKLMQDVHHYYDKPQDYQYDYYKCPHQYDAQLHPQSIYDLICLAYASDVIKHNHSHPLLYFVELDYHKDHQQVHAIKYNLYLLSHQLPQLLSSLNKEDILTCFYCKNVELLHDKHRIFLQALVKKGFQLQYPSSIHHIYFYLFLLLCIHKVVYLLYTKEIHNVLQSIKQFLYNFCLDHEDFLPFLSVLVNTLSLASDTPLFSNICFSKIISIEPTSVKAYYTLSVPVYQQYFSGGILHHNSGKSWLAIHTILMRAIKFPNTTHLVIRKFSSSLRRTLFEQTLLPILRDYNIYDQVDINRTNLTVTLPNKSKILFLSIQNPIQQDRLLGIECASIFADEISEITFEQFELMQSRLREKIKGELRIITACNPTTKASWIYQYFINKVNPKTKLPHNIKVFNIQLKAEDNKDHLGDGYIDQLKQLSNRQRKRFYEGDFATDTEHSLFKQDLIELNRKEDIKEYDRIVIGVDPAVSNNEDSCEHGIIVAGIKDNDVYVLRDESGKMSSKEVVNKICALNRLYKADKVFVETNNGGDWIIDSISHRDSHCPTEGIHQKVGKAIRAEPVAFLEQKGLLHHTKIFVELEEQLISWNGTGASPDRLDAYVIAIGQLTYNQEQKLDFNFGEH